MDKDDLGCFGCLGSYFLIVLGSLLVFMIVVFGFNSFFEFIDSREDAREAERESELNYHAAIKANDYEQAHEILGKLYDNYVSAYKNNSEYSSDQVKIIGAASRYTTAAVNVYGAEVRYIMADGGDNAIERIVYLLTELPVLGQRIPEGTEIDSYDMRKTDIACYRLYVQCNNQICDIIFDIAMNTGNKRLAAIALNKYLAIPASGDGENSDRVTYYSNTDSIARVRFDKAVSDGVFGEE